MPERIYIPRKSSADFIQRSIYDAVRVRVPVVIEPWAYELDRMIVVPAWSDVRVNGGLATFVGVTANPILNVTGEGVTIEGLSFQGGVAGVTAITGNFVRTRITRCRFWTTLERGIDGYGLLSEFSQCSFGMEGPIPQFFQPIRIRGGGANNQWLVDRCSVYRAAGDTPAIEFGEGYQLELSRCNVELNDCAVAVKIAGMYGAHVHHNWFENNSGAAQVELVNDETGLIGNYSVTSEHNWWNLDGRDNAYAYAMGGASKLSFDRELGTSWPGKAIASDMTNVSVGDMNRLLGYQP